MYSELLSREREPATDTHRSPAEFGELRRSGVDDESTEQRLVFAVVVSVAVLRLMLWLLVPWKQQLPYNLRCLNCWRQCSYEHQARMAKPTSTDAPKVFGLDWRKDDDVISNGVPPPSPPPEVALSLGVFSVLSAAGVGAGVSAERGIVVTDVCTTDGVDGSGRLTDVVTVAGSWSGNL